jgi:hypothetical protein
MEVKKATDKSKTKLLSLVMEVASLQTVIVDRIFKESMSELEAISKMQTFRDSMEKLADKLVWKKLTN